MVLRQLKRFPIVLMSNVRDLYSRFEDENEAADKLVLDSSERIHSIVYIKTGGSDSEISKFTFRILCKLQVSQLFSMKIQEFLLPPITSCIYGQRIVT